jgi:regulator of sigma E protease
MTFVLTLAGIILLFSLTIFVHELGHYLAARACGMVIEVFSIGFGPSLWQKRIKGVLYKIGALPFGGYVALPQLDPTGESLAADPETPGRMIPPASPGQKIVVAAAGAFGNLLLAVALAWIVYWAGKPSAPHERQCVIGFVEEGSEAWTSGLRIGDEILRVDDQAVGNWQDLLTILALSSGGSADLTVRDLAGGPGRAVRIPTEKGGFGLRLPIGIELENLCRVGGVMAGGSAETAGLEAGDLILELDGKKIFSRQHLMAVVNQARDRDLPIRIKRGKDLLDRIVRPTYDPKEDRVLIGILFSPISVDFDTITHPRPLTQLREHATGILRFLRALVTPKEARAAAGAVGGPVSILYTYWQMMESSFRMALWFTVFLNVNLGILNLLPIPVLDGGHIVFAVYHGLFRRPAPKGLVLWSYRVFATLLIGVFILLTARDSKRWILPLFDRDRQPTEAPAPEEP